MTNSTVSTAGGAMPGAVMPLTFDVKRGMYGTCKRIVGRIGPSGEAFAEAFFWDIGQKWDVEIFNADGSVSETYSIDVSDREQAVDQVEALMNLVYRGATARRAA
jgi:hypothetical protein